MTTDTVYEVKKFAHWKHGLGQVLVYAKCERKKACLILYDCPRRVDIRITNMIEEFGVEVTLTKHGK